MSPGPQPVTALFYVQHLLGIGHLMRAGTLARALEAAGIRVTLVSGGMPVPVFEPRVTRFVQLPPTRAADRRFKVLVDEHGGEIDAAWKDARRERLLAVFDREQPDVLLIELYPFGRRQMRFEIEPLLERAKAAQARSGRPLIASSVRDILVQPDKPERIDEMVSRARRFFDLILVHGDPRLVPFEHTFPRLREIEDLICDTGYVVDAVPARQGAGAPGRGEVIVSTGGGAVSEDMLQAAIDARALTRLADAPWRVLIGYNYPPSRFRACQRAAPRGVRIERARSDFAQLLANCELSISQGGYNTVMEILATGVPAVCVPYAGGYESEQTLRCRLLARRGVLQVVEQDAISAETVARAAERALDVGRSAGNIVDTRGAQRSAELLLARLLHQRAQRGRVDA